MLDFTSSQYLGLRHPFHALEPWTTFTLGGPAALAEPEGFKAVAHALARLQGCERGVLAPSTLHLFWDLFGLLGDRRNAIYCDAGIYPIARWGVERAAGKGAVVRFFSHHNPIALRQLMDGCERGTRPVVVADGFCPACGSVAPLEEYLACAREYGGVLVIDDTQALGIFGHSPGPAFPYGRDGGGVLRWSGIHGDDIMVIASLAKGFGVPLAVLSGSSLMIRQFEKMSGTRVHCSPPSIAVVHVARRALAVNRQRGDELRLRLAMLVERFSRGVDRAGLATTSGIFPMQTLEETAAIDGIALHAKLLRAGVRTVLQQAGRGGRGRVTLIISAFHDPLMVDRAVAALRRAAADCR
ncbi:pyridoxal-5'-phosphate-dependent enzyme [Geotalea daltonii FRC-32]|uniref:Pyridoxal-5'-phosphate-dependent enzyme n=1 Tax=Geotalea daltonii (strain DSM 22248 / JCM 15807 / FRC-32) TaxID=316067 RepID=B9M9K7_GEODF|nr:aminotransferase class I/II-fold pyridoxal phosphate-dependent enzyme [Geotalea daltonii]ACM20579.1 pyridoxal-5'-phosphate-dependent enzyme [Geotalea daltonii FRC-32]